MMLGALAGGSVQTLSNELASGVDGINDGRGVLLQTCISKAAKTPSAHSATLTVTPFTCYTTRCNIKQLCCRTLQQNSVLP